MSIVTRFFPNGEFSQGVDTSKQRRDRQRRDVSVHKKLDKERRDEYLQWKAWFDAEMPSGFVHTVGNVYMSPTGNTYTLREISPKYTCLEWCDIRNTVYTIRLCQDFTSIFFAWRLVPLVHQMLENCEKPKSRKKLEKMTSSMSRNIRNGVFLLERLPGGKDCLSFLTLTLPNLSSESLDNCCRNWDKMTKRFFDWLRTRLEKYNMQLQHVYCTEIQQKRLQKRHEYAPHLHIVFRGRNAKKSPWVVTPKQVRKAWVRCIRSVVTEQFSETALENIQRIKYSAARYLAKYLGKSARSVSVDAKESVNASLHTQWGGMSRDIARAIKQNTKRITDTRGDTTFIWRFLGSLDRLRDAGLIAYYKCGVINTCEPGVETFGFGILVCCGALSTPLLDGGLDRIIDFLQQEPSLNRDEFL